MKNAFNKHLCLGLGAALLALAPALGQASVVVGDTNMIVNGSFENVPFGLSGSDGSYCYVGSSNFGCAAPLPDWDGRFALIASGSGAWSATPATGADRFHVGLQNDSFFTQEIVVGSPGQYTLTWSDAGRSGYADETYQVSFGGVLLATQTTVGGQGWATHSVSFSSAFGYHTLAFTGLTVGGDATAFVDNLSMAAAVPEPASWALLAGGLFGVATVARRRRA